MEWISPLVFVSVLILAFCGTYLALALRTRRGEIGKRLSLIRIRSLEEDGVPEFLKRDLLSDVPLLNEVLAKFRSAIRIEKRLRQAGIAWTVGTFFLLSAVLFGTGYLFGFLQGWPWFLSAGLGAALMCIPWMVVSHRRGRRLSAFARLLPDTLEMFSRSLRAGHSFTGAIQLIAQEMPDPVGPEFQKVFEEQNLGIPIRQALIDLAERIESMDVRFLVTAVLIQRDTGGNLAEIIDKISYVIRDRIRIQGQVRVATAAARTSGNILIFLAPVMALVIYWLNPNYLRPLWLDPWGKKIVSVAFALQIAGTLIIRKIIRIKV